MVYGFVKFVNQKFQNLKRLQTGGRVRMTESKKLYMSRKTSPYIAKINGVIGVYCVKCSTKLGSKDKVCPGCFRTIK